MTNVQSADVFAPKQVKSTGMRGVMEDVREFVRLTKLLTAVVLISPLAVYSQSTSAGLPPLLEISQLERLQSLVSTNIWERHESACKLDWQRKELVGKLMEILNSTNSAEMKREAVIVLGEYRASEAVPLLVSHLQWDEVIPRGHENGHMLIEDEYYVTGPVFSALASIGPPAIPALLGRIALTTEKNISGKCVAICTRIEGQDVTQFRLQELLKKETDPKRKAGIKAGLEALKNVGNLINNIEHN